jgi:hypothetical protein
MGRGRYSEARPAGKNYTVTQESEAGIEKPRISRGLPAKGPSINATESALIQKGIDKRVCLLSTPVGSQNAVMSRISNLRFRVVGSGTRAIQSRLSVRNDLHIAEFFEPIFAELNAYP